MNKSDAKCTVKEIFMESLQSLSNIELIDSYSSIVRLLKERKIIRTKNITGEFGEYYAIEYYSNTSGLPNLQAAPPSTQNIDAISKTGKRYSIKTVSGTNKTTGVFYGLNRPSTESVDDIRFEYLLIVILSDSFELDKILELTWDQFLQYKRWHTRMEAWSFPINKTIVEQANVVFQREQ